MFLKREFFITRVRYFLTGYPMSATNTAKAATLAMTANAGSIPAI